MSDRGTRALAAPRVGDEIRALHVWAFRSGQWARVTGEAVYRGRLCYLVRWLDGIADYWVVNDPKANYEVRPGRARELLNQARLLGAGPISSGEAAG